MHNHELHAHDHSHGAEACLADAEAACAAAGETLTPLRRRVLSLLLEASGPAKAYDLLARLKDDGAAKPPTIYRALEFLMRLGLVHRIESLNAYIACAVHGCARPTAFLICDRCGVTVETDGKAALADVHAAAASQDFSVTRVIAEAHGVCAHCRSGR
jgi:Fur family zinc uptake transcriptional regulator